MKNAHFLKDDILQEEGLTVFSALYFISNIDMVSLLKLVNEKISSSKNQWGPHHSPEMKWTVRIFCEHKYILKHSGLANWISKFE